MISLPSLCRTIDTDEIHIWSIEQQKAAWQIESFRNCLTPEERGQSNSFCSNHLRNRFILSRGLLRTVLGFYLKIAPSEVTLIRGAHGKPYVLQPGVSEYRYHFSLSNSGAITTLAVNLDREIGIDIEEMRTIASATSIIEQFFSDEESAVLKNLSANQRLEAFFRCWTAKEAFLKATGEGLSRKLDSFTVSFEEDNKLALVSIDSMTEAASSWRLWELQIAPGYKSALAIQTEEDLKLSNFEWDYRLN